MEKRTKNNLTQLLAMLIGAAASVSAYFLTMWTLGFPYGPIPVLLFLTMVTLIPIGAYCAVIFVVNNLYWRDGNILIFLGVLAAVIMVFGAIMSDYWATQYTVIGYKYNVGYLLKGATGVMSASVFGAMLRRLS